MPLVNKFTEGKVCVLFSLCVKDAHSLTGSLVPLRESGESGGKKRPRFMSSMRSKN